MTAAIALYRPGAADNLHFPQPAFPPRCSVSPSQNPAGLPLESPLASAERAVAAARAAGDLRREAAALTDLGILLGPTKPDTADGAFAAAVAAAERVGDPVLLSDVNAYRGAFLVNSGRREDGIALIESALAGARTAGDRFAEKAALQRLGSARVAAGDPERALDAYARAIAAARELGDDRHAAELYWLTAIVRADLGETESASAAGEAAVRLFRQLRHPETDRLQGHLEHYRAGGGGLQGPTTFVGGAGFADVQATPAGLPAGPGVLKMAWSAVQAAARFVGAGMRTVSPGARALRLATCEVCEHHTGTRCRLCGCFTALKTHLPHETCPAGKWLP